MAVQISDLSFVSFQSFRHLFLLENRCAAMASPPRKIGQKSKIRAFYTLSRVLLEVLVLSQVPALVAVQ
jgi:hypothetical protein